MIEMWNGSESKQRHEQLVASWVGNACMTLADIGCGSGRYASVLYCSGAYYGYDISTEMIREAKERYEKTAQNECAVEFAVVDAMNYSSDRHYDVALIVDVAQHYDDPIGSLLKLFRLWEADRYIVSFLVGDERKDLYATTVVAFSELLWMLDKMVLTRAFIDHAGPENFAWVLLELKKSEPQ